MVPPPPPNTRMWPAPRSLSMSTMYLKYSTWPPWYELSAMPSASSCNAARTTSSTLRLCPRCTTSAPCAWINRRMMLMAASWPSNRLAAVTKRSGVASVEGAAARMVLGVVLIGWRIELAERQLYADARGKLAASGADSTGCGKWRDSAFLRADALPPHPTLSPESIRGRGLSAFGASCVREGLDAFGRTGCAIWLVPISYRAWTLLLPLPQQLHRWGRGLG